MSDYETLPRQLQSERTKAGKSQSEAARLLGCTPQAISNWERGYTRIDCISLFKLLRWYGADIYSFFRAIGLESREGEGEDGESRLLRSYRSLSEGDRGRLGRIAQVLSGEDQQEEAAPQGRIIPLFHYLAAAGIPSPQPGADFEDLAVDASCRADFAARIAGDSMEPWVCDGDTVYCRRTVELADGDVGIFYAGDGMVCKQYLRDSEGSVYLFSLNRARREADVFFPASSGKTLMCYGKVLLPQRIPLPED